MHFFFQHPLLKERMQKLTEYSENNRQKLYCFVTLTRIPNRNREWGNICGCLILVIITQYKKIQCYILPWDLQGHSFGYTKTCRGLYFHILNMELECYPVHCFYLGNLSSDGLFQSTRCTHWPANPRRRKMNHGTVSQQTTFSIVMDT